MKNFGAAFRNPTGAGWVGTLKGGPMDGKTRIKTLAQRWQHPTRQEQEVRDKAGGTRRAGGFPQTGEDRSSRSG